MPPRGTPRTSLFTVRAENGPEFLVAGKFFYRERERREKTEEESGEKHKEAVFFSHFSFLFQCEPFREEVFKINNVLSVPLSVPQTPGLN